MQKLYRHYKNKLYRVKGFTKHSETLEGMVHYEALYDNPTARFWSRPKKMFFGTVQTPDGREVPRFAPVEIEVRLSTAPTESDLKICEELMASFFGFVDAEDFRETLQLKTKVCLLIASFDGKPVGFKLGYAQDRDEFYSWLGGTHPDYQRLGVAGQLMKAQYDWCKAQGFKKIRTKTENRHRAMLRLNLRQGFQIIGTQQSSKHLKVILEKAIV